MLIATSVYFFDTATLYCVVNVGISQSFLGYKCPFRRCSPLGQFPYGTSFDLDHLAMADRGRTNRPLNAMTLSFI
jgi:hypothetical protein